MKILLTGGAGFIGSNIADAFLKDGHQVFIIDDLSNGSTRNLPECPFAKLDINSPQIDGIFSSFKPEVLCHHAAQIDVRSSVNNPMLDAHANIIGTLNLLELCKKHGTNRVLFASSGGAIYGEQKEFPATELHSIRPLSPYGIAKMAVEAYLDFYTSEHGFKTTILRYSNVYGPRQNSNGEAGVISIFCRKLLDGKAPTIYGDGEQTRDYIYISDVVRANVLTINKGITGTFNIGTGIETTVNCLYNELCRMLSYDNFRPTYAPVKHGEQRRSCISYKKLENEIGWQPKVLVKDGLLKTIQYLRRNR